MGGAASGGGLMKAGLTAITGVMWVGVDVPRVQL